MAIFTDNKIPYLYRIFNWAIQSQAMTHYINSRLQCFSSFISPYAWETFQHWRQGRQDTGNKAGETCSQAGRCRSQWNCRCVKDYWLSFRHDSIHIYINGCMQIIQGKAKQIIQMTLSGLCLWFLHLFFFVCAWTAAQTGFQRIIHPVNTFSPHWTGGKCDPHYMSIGSCYSMCTGC